MVIKKETTKDGMAWLWSSQVQGHQTQPHLKGLIHVYKVETGYQLRFLG